ncbi:MAG: sulfatase-like hydrolase/transferase, partial [Planctomycetales bacterium]
SMPVCHPTRVCLMTGKYPFRLGNPRWGSFPKSEEQRTVAHVLRRAGYATAVVGKWQLTLLKKNPDHPRQLGFDVSALFGWHEGPRYYEPMIYQNGKVRDDLAGRFGPDVYCDVLIDFMRKNKDRPFFAYYPMALCHDVTDDLKEPVPRGPKGRYDNFKEMVEKTDERVGRLVKAVDELGIRKHTLILFTGDNGTPKSYIHSAVDGKLIRKKIVSKMGDQTVLGGKGQLTNAGTNVPLIANWPGTIKGKQVVNDLVDFSDFLPTFAELAKASVPEGIDGRSFACRLKSGKPSPRTWAFAEGRGKRFVRTVKWKLYSDGRLFDVAADSLETKQGIARDGDAAEARAALQKALDNLGQPGDR